MSRNAKILLAAVMLIAAFTRFWHITATPPGLYPDEAMNGNNAVEAMAERHLKVFYPDNNGREGLFINIQSLFISAFGNEPWALRLPSAIFGTLTVLGLFFLAELLFRGVKTPHEKLAGMRPSEIIGLAAAFFTAASFWHINFSRIGFRAIMAPFFLTWGLYFFFRVYKNVGSANSQIFFAAVGGLLFGLGAHSYIAYRIAPLLLALPIWTGLKAYYSKAEEQSGRRESCFPCMVAFFFFFAFIAVLPLGIYFLKHPGDFLGRTSQISIFTETSPIELLAINTAKTIGMFWVYGDGNWRHNFAAAPELAPPVGIFFLLGIIFALKSFFLRGSFAKVPEKFNAAFLLLWLFLMLAPVVISSEHLPHALRAIIAIPPVMILTAFGLWVIIDKTAWWLKKQKNVYPDFSVQLDRIGKELAAGLFLLSILMTIHAGDRYLDRWANHPRTDDAFAGRDWRLTQYLRGLDANAEKYVLIEGERIDERIVTISAQSVLFGTGTFLPDARAAKKFTYLSPEELEARLTGPSAYSPQHAYIVSLKKDNIEFLDKLREKLPNIIATAPLDFIVLELRK